MKSILLTGGTGFIGSHTAVELIKSGHKVIIADNLSNSDASIIERIRDITGISPVFYRIDVTETESLDYIFEEEEIDAVIHFAGYKAVGESVEKPLEYYRNNLDAVLSLLEIMRKHDCKHLIFSSSATVYSLTDTVPFSEDTYPLGCTNPYGWTKYMIEQILKDVCVAYTDMSVVLLRYFNPIGAHPSGMIGEKPNGIPNNIMPYITQVACGLRDKLYIFGNDYPTHDGTGVRDYIHVVDLAKGHVAALEYCKENLGCEVFNLGTGTGYSVLELVSAFERVNGIEIPYEVIGRRSGDIAISYADSNKANKMLNWVAKKGIDDMCRDAWKWQTECNKMK